MNIGLDVDGVLGDWDKQAQKVLRYWGVNSEWKLIYPSPSWDHIQKTIEPEAWDRLWDPANAYEIFGKMERHDGAQEGMKILSEIGDIVVITSRPTYAAPITLDWLSKFNVPIKSFHLTGHNEKKSSFTKCDVFLDDRPRNYEDLSIPGTKPFLWSRPHNMDFKCSNRITKWSNFISEVLKVRDGRG